MFSFRVARRLSMPRYDTELALLSTPVIEGHEATPTPHPEVWLTQIGPDKRYYQ